MGSTGTGRFSDYQDEVPGQKEAGTEDENRCTEEISVFLEEVERSEYYNSKGNLPDVGTSLSISAEKRITARVESGETVGFLPTKYNYFLTCLQEGYVYSIYVSQSVATPMAQVEVTISPVEPE